MLPRENRFHSAYLLNLVKRKGQRTANPFFRVSFLPSRFDNSLFAVVVGQQVSKKAVERNRLRRQVYEIIRTQNLHKTIKKHLVLISLLPSALGKKAQILSDNLQKVLPNGN